MTDENTPQNAQDGPQSTNATQDELATHQTPHKPTEGLYARSMRDIAPVIQQYLCDSAKYVTLLSFISADCSPIHAESDAESTLSQTLNKQRLRFPAFARPLRNSEGTSAQPSNDPSDTRPPAQQLVVTSPRWERTLVIESQPRTPEEQRAIVEAFRTRRSAHDRPTYHETGNKACDGCMVTHVMPACAMPGEEHNWKKLLGGRQCWACGEQEVWPDVRSKSRKSVRKRYRKELVATCRTTFRGTKSRSVLLDAIAGSTRLAFSALEWAALYRTLGIDTKLAIWFVRQATTQRLQRYLRRLPE